MIKGRFGVMGLVLGVFQSHASVAAVLESEVLEKPARGDVIIRTLKVTETRPGRLGTIDAAKAFGANRAEWIYHVDEAFVEQARGTGIQVGTTMNYNAQPFVSRWPDYLERFTSRDPRGNPVTRYNFRKFKNWQIEHFTPDVNVTGWNDLYVDYLEQHYAVPVIAIHRDDQAGTAGLLVDGGSYTDASVAMFQRYLSEQVPKETLQRLGIEDPETFDIRVYLIERGAPGTEPDTEHQKWFRWDGGPVLRLFAEAQRDAMARFYREVRQRVEDRTGRKIPWSCNHTGQWGPIEQVFDYALGEFYTHQMQIETLAEIARRAEQAGKVQGLQGVLDGGWEKRDPTGLTEEMRRFVATAYAFGMNPMVPWDMYMPGKAKRYYGKPSDFADLFLWVRANQHLFNGYDTALIRVFDPNGSRQQWRKNQQVDGPSHIRGSAIQINRAGVLGVVREQRAGNASARVVHLVDWNEKKEPFEITLDIKTLSGASAASVSLLRPGTSPLELSTGNQCTVTVPALNPWGMLVVSPLPEEGMVPDPPVLLDPAGPVIPVGTAINLAASDEIEVRFSATEAAAWRKYEPGLFTLNKDGVVEARSVRRSPDGTPVFSPVARWRFWTFVESALEPVPEKGWHSCRAQWVAESGSGGVAEGRFQDGMPLVYEGQEFSSGFGSTGEVVFSVAVPESAAAFKTEILLADDTSSLRPSYRVTVETVEFGVLYETPIVNPVKSVLYGQEPTRQTVSVLLPEGVQEIFVRVHSTGWFPEHNRLIWQDPAFLMDRENKWLPVRRVLRERCSALQAASQSEAGATSTFDWTGGEQ
jgi:hypothetical protein